MKGFSLVTLSVFGVLGCSEIAGLSGDYCARDEPGCDEPGDDGDSPLASGGMGGTTSPRAELPEGDLVFVRDDGSATKLFHVTLPAGTAGDIGLNFGLCKPSDPSFHPTRRELVVTAVEQDGNCAEANPGEQQLFLLKLGAPDAPAIAPMPLTGPSSDFRQPVLGENFVYFQNSNRIARFSLEAAEAGRVFTGCDEAGEDGLCFDHSGDNPSHPTFVGGDSPQLCFSRSGNIECVALGENETLGSSLNLDDAASPQTMGAVTEVNPTAAGNHVYFESPLESDSEVFTLNRFELGETSLPSTFTQIVDSHLAPTLLNEDLLAFEYHPSKEGPGDIYVGTFGEAEVGPIGDLFPNLSGVEQGDERHPVFRSAE